MDTNQPNTPPVSERIKKIREKFSATQSTPDANKDSTLGSDFENFVKWEPPFDNSPWHNFGNLSGN